MGRRAQGNAPQARLGFSSRLVSGLAQELLYQGHVASRLTGLTPADTARAIRAARRSKHLIAASFALLMLMMLLSFRTAFGPKGALLPLVVFTWTFAPIFLVLTQLSYGIASVAQIRELLLSLPLPEGQARRAAALALLRTLDAPLAVPLLALLASTPLIGGAALLAGLLSYATAASLAIATNLLLIRLYYRAGRRPFLLLRVLAAVLLISLFPLPLAYLQAQAPQLGSWEEAFVPLLNLAGVARLDLAALPFALLYTAAFAWLGYRLLMRSSLELLSPHEAAPPSSGRFRVKLRSPSIAIAMTDLRQLFRSPRLVGILVVPFVYALVSLLQASTRPASAPKPFDYELAFAANALPLIAASSFVAYALYLSELRGLSYLVTLPLGRFTDVKGKLVATLAFFLGAAPILPLALGRMLYLIPLLAFAPTVAACVLYTSLYFRYVVRSLAIGAIGLVNQAVYAVINLIVFGIPASVYLVGLFATNSFTAPLPYLLAASSAEISVLCYLLARSKGPY